jgi:hypothetical protein
MPICSPRGRKIVEAEASEDGEAGERERKAERSAERRKQEALDDELPRDTPPAGAERAADGDLALARHVAREQEVCDVRAPDQHQEPDGAEQHEQRRPYVADHMLVDGRDLDPNAVVRCRVLAREPLRDPIQICLSLRHRHARREPRHHPEDAQ